MKKKAIAALLLGAVMLSGCGRTAGTSEPLQTLPEGAQTEGQTDIVEQNRIDIGEKGELECVYETDFSSFNAMDSVMLSGQLEIRDGMLRTRQGASGGYSTVLFKIGEYDDFVYEADFIDHVSGGGLVFLCNGDKVRHSSDGFCGYMAYIGREGGVGALGCATNDGKWSGNFAVSPEDITKPGDDLHLRVRVTGNHIIYTVTDIESGDEVYRYEYIKGDSKKYDKTPNDRGMIGLRMYNDGGKGGFDNIKLYARKEIAESDAALAVSERVDATLTANDFESFVTFKANGAGYAFSYDASVQRLVLYTMSGGQLKYAAQHAMPVKQGKQYQFSAVNKSDRLAFYFEDGDVPVFEIAHSGEEYKIGASDPVSISITEVNLTAASDIYLNPVADGADPEVLYHDGVYYLYTSHNKKVRVRTSRDLVNWQEAGCAFTLGSESQITSFMSPNVFFSDGLFYLIIASRTGGSSSSTDFKLYYASSKSPTGPFVMKGDKPYINEENEIGGAPYIDADGRIYITSVRFGGGNNIYIQEITAKDGVITPAGEAVHCISPTEHYEIDNWGKITEGGVIYKHGGYYYMMYASGHYKGHYGEAYAVSKSLYGPWKKYEYNDVLDSNVYADGVGDCVFVTSPEGELFVMYHRHTNIGNEGSSRSICIDRVFFTPSEDGGPDVLRVFGPTVTSQAMPR